MATDNNRGDQFARHAAAVAREFYGEPNKQLSSKDELRFGSHGSLSVDLKKGTWFDHSEDKGGGVLALIERETGRKNGEAVEWLRDHGFDIEDRGDSYQQAAQAGSNRNAGPRLDRHGNWLPQRVPDHGELTKTYDYRDENGKLVYQVCRYDWTVPIEENPKGHEKTFVQRKPDSSKKNGWSYEVKGTTPYPYRLPELLEDIADGAEIFIVEGEKKADMLREIGVPATCNSGGAGKFPEEVAKWFAGAKVTILPDNDPQARNKKTGELLFHEDGRPKFAGKDHAALVGNKLTGISKRVRILEIPDLPPKGGVDDWLPAGGSAERLYELAQGAKPFEAVPYESRFGAVSWLDFDKPGQSYEALIKGVLTVGELSLLIGESQSGKSFLAIDIAMAVARGIPWFGKRSRRGGVIYQAGESAVGVRRKRFPAYRKHNDVANEPLPVVLLQAPLDLYSSDDPTDAFIDECLYWSRTFDVPLELITIDTFNKATPGANENDGKDMGVVLARCDRIRQKTGAHVMLVHHLNAGGTKARGHTSLFANVENVILVRQVPDHSDADGRKVREAVIAKQKDGEDGVSFKFVLPQVVIGQDEDGDKITSCIIAPPAGSQGEAAPKPGALQLGGANQKFLRALYDVLDDALAREPAPPEAKLAAGARAVPRKALTARFFQLEKPDDFDSLPDEEKKRKEDAARQALKRARDALYSKRIIGMNEDLVWATGKPVQGFGPPPGMERRERGEKNEAPPENFDDLPFDDSDLAGL